MKVEIWSDVVCPWCYVGKRQFEQALAEFEHADQLEIVWRSYELDPRAPEIREGTYAERIARKYGLEVGAARAAMSRMINAGAEAGIEFKFDSMQPGNTFNAHRLIHLGNAKGIGAAVKERLLQATFHEGAAIGTRDVLLRLGVEAGLAEADVVAVLDGEQFADEVRVDERVAHALGVTGVPFFLIDETYGVPGAQDPQVYLNLLNRAWGETHRSITIVGAEDGVVCDDEVCEI